MCRSDGDSHATGDEFRQAAVTPRACFSGDRISRLALAAIAIGRATYVMLAERSCEAVIRSRVTSRFIERGWRSMNLPHAILPRAISRFSARAKGVSAEFLA